MRALLEHERKLIEQLLRRVPVPTCKVPQNLHALFVMQTPIAGHVELNLGFSAYFEPEDQPREPELVSNCLTAPGFICGELCLVRNKCTNQLTFLEYFGQCPPDGAYIRPYVDPVCQFIESLAYGPLVNRARALCGQLRLASLERWRRRKSESGLGHVRMLIFDSLAFFFLGESSELLFREPSQSTEFASDKGVLQFLASDSNEVAIEGWMHVEEKWD